MNRTPLVALFAVACLGLVTWTLLGGDGDATLTSAPPAAMVAAEPGPAAVPASSSPVATDAAAKLVAPTAPAVERSEATPVAPAKGATVMVRGRLVDRAGTPRAGLALQMSTWSSNDNEVFDFEGFSPQGQNTDGKRPTWNTNADGQFAIPLAKDHSGMLELADTELLFASAAPRVRGKQGDQDLGDLKTLRPGVLRGVVQDQAGKPLADVKVGASQDVLALDRSSTKTDADGKFMVGKLKPGKWSVRTASGKFLPTTLEVTIGDEEERNDLVLVVNPGNAIAGQVVDERGVGVAEFKVGCKRMEARGGVSIERFAPDEATTTDGNGYFTLSGLAEELASVRAFGKNHSTAVASDVKVGTGDLVMRVERLGAVEGVLVDGEGKPVADSTVRAQGAGAPEADGVLLEEFDDLPMPGRSTTKTGADGSFRLEGVRPGAATILARGKGHRPTRQAGVNVIAAQTTKGLRLLVDRGAVARITVLDDAGKPVAKADVKLERPPAADGPGGAQVFSSRAEISGEGHEAVFVGDQGLGSGITDENGIAEIAGLAAGDAMVAATHADFAAAETVRCALPRSGTTEATVRLRVPGRAEITVLGADGAPLVSTPVRVTVDSNDGDGKKLEQTTNEHGVATFGSLVPGSYKATLVRQAKPNRIGSTFVMIDGNNDAIASSTQRLTVVARDITKVTLRAPLMTKLHGIVSGVDGPVVGCIVELQKRDSDTIGMPGMGGPSERTGSDGSFAFADVESGDYTLRFGKEDQLVRASQPVNVPPATPELRQDLALRTGKLRARIVALGSGDAISGAQVEVVDGTAPTTGGAPRQERRVMMVSMTMNNDGGGESTTMTMGNQSAKSDEDGLVEIDDVPAGVWKLQVRHKKFSAITSSAQTVVDRQVTDCGRLEMSTAGQVRGKVLQADGKPARLAMVTNRLVGTETWSAPEMAQGGSFRIGGLAPGKYQVRAQEVNMGDNSGPGAFTPTIEVEVKGGETASIDLQLPAK